MMDKRKLKIVIMIVAVFVISMSITSQVFAEEKELMDEKDIEAELIEELEIDNIEYFWKDLKKDYGKFLTEIQTKQIRDLIDQKGGLSLRSITKGLFHYLLYEIIENASLLLTLLLLVLVATILQMMLTTFEKNTVSKVTHFVVTIVLLYVTLQSFHLSINYTKETIEVMGSFIIALFPLMLGLVASLGQVTQVAFFHPFIVMLLPFSNILLTKFVFPLLYLAVLLVVISQLNDRFKATQLAELLRSISLTSLGLYIGVFLTILSIQGTVTAVQDGVALKTTKFITSNFIPVIGQSVTDAADTILAASLLIKNTIGIVGLIVIVLYAVFPAIKIAVIAFMYKLVAALLQPLAPKEIIRSLQTISSYMIYILASLLAMTFTFFLTIVILIGASHLPLLLR